MFTKVSVVKDIGVVVTVLTVPFVGEVKVLRELHRELKRGATLTMTITLSILDRSAKFYHCCKQVQQGQYEVTHHTLCMMLHYLGKLRNQKFAILMHVKHVSNVTIYPT